MLRIVQFSTALLIASAALMPAAASAAGQPVTFEDVAAINNAGSANVASGNYTFLSNAQGVVDLASDLSGVPIQTGNNHYLVFGTTSSTPGVSFVESDGRAFNLYGLDLAGWYQLGSAPWSVTVTGYRANTSTVISTLNVASSSFSSFAASSFGGFNNLMSVSITGTQQPSGYYLALDNVIATPVPEPETYALMLAGLMLLGTVARRRSKGRV